MQLCKTSVLKASPYVVHQLAANQLHTQHTAFEPNSYHQMPHVVTLQVATWQSSHPSGLEVFYFPSGQVEGHTAAGVKDIVFPDGSIRRVQPDG